MEQNEQQQAPQEQSVLPQALPETPPSSPKKSWNGYPRWVNIFTLTVFAFFGASLLFIPASTTRDDFLTGIFMYSWFIGAGLAALAVVVFLIAGLVRLSRKQGAGMIGYAFVMLFAFGLVGFGSCMMNLSWGHVGI